MGNLTSFGPLTVLYTFLEVLLERHADNFSKAANFGAQVAPN